ncbi:MAG: 3-hydroxyacyl-[acyl-carrier-protein] dehydratase [Aliidongia sp.]|jgi:3-hydroxyacyl-[acyl-carrier-protein] dehydratase|nr:3-hydroxyacyl-[acyl-carrier-protein] dehydratase [Aliidongia sp.]
MDAAEPKETVPDLDIHQIMQCIPHRYPFLMIEKLTEIVPHESAVAIKNVSVNEPHFQGHFPDRPIMPGVLIVEAMAQAAACLVVHSLAIAGEGRMVYFMSIESARFRKPVVPGDQLRIHVKKQQHRRNVWRFAGEAKVDGVLVAEATYTAMIADPPAS